MKQKYLLMHKKNPVVECEYDTEMKLFVKVGSLYDERHLPLGVHMIAGNPNKTELNTWWKGRNIPKKRWDDTMKALGNGIPDMISGGHGASLSDQYWIMPVGEQISWNDINYFENAFDQKIGDVFLGNSRNKELLKNKEIFSTPNTTTNGNLKKSWEVIDGDICLVKAGSGQLLQEPFNEKFISKAYQMVSRYPAVSYDVIYRDEMPFSVCRNFVTAETEFIPAIDVINSVKKRNDMSYLEHFISLCERHEVPQAQEIMETMFAMDFIMGNKDRHFGNFGIIRNAETLQWEGIAPVFDNGNSLWFDESTMRMRVKDDIVQCNSICDTQNKIIEKIRKLPEFDDEKLRRFPEEMEQIFQKSVDIDQARIDKIAEGIEYRVALYESILNRKS